MTEAQFNKIKKIITPLVSELLLNIKYNYLFTLEISSRYDPQKSTIYKLSQDFEKFKIFKGDGISNPTIDDYYPDIILRTIYIVPKDSDHGTIQIELISKDDDNLHVETNLQKFYDSLSKNKKSVSLCLEKDPSVNGVKYTLIIHCPIF